LFEICILLEHTYLNSHAARRIIWELLKSMFVVSRTLHQEYQPLIKRYLASNCQCIVTHWPCGKSRSR